jgi:hypothetical protein
LEKLTTPREEKRSSIITDSDLISSGANRDNKSGNRHFIGGEKDGKKGKAGEAKARNKSNEIRE